MHLCERERYILLCLVYAANEASDRTGHKGTFTHTPPYDFWINSDTMRALQPFLSLHLLIVTGKKDAVLRVTGIDAEVFTKEYLFYFHDRQRSDSNEITPMEVRMLHDRMKAELKDTVSNRKYRPRIMYISDCHFYHDNLCRNMDHRGFSGYEEMNDHMIKQWNDKVNPKDEVYILGDFAFGNREAAEGILKQLNGKLHLIIGNHDRFLEDKHFDRSLFRSIEHYSEIRDTGRTVILSHYPVFCYKGQYRTDGNGNPLTYMLYGHVHNTHDEQLVQRFIMETRATLVQSKYDDYPKPIPCHMINCFCMFSNYQPLTLDEWIALDRSRRSALERIQEE